MATTPDETRQDDEKEEGRSPGHPAEQKRHRAKEWTEPAPRRKPKEQPWWWGDHEDAMHGPYEKVRLDVFQAAYYLRFGPTDERSRFGYQQNPYYPKRLRVFDDERETRSQKHWWQRKLNEWFPDVGDAGVSELSPEEVSRRRNHNKGGSVTAKRKPREFAKGGTYRGKPHAYAAGGRVTDTSASRKQARRKR